jgi:hypothetical protein
VREGVSNIFADLPVADAAAKRARPQSVQRTDSGSCHGLAQALLADEVEHVDQPGAAAADDFAK